MNGCALVPIVVFQRPNGRRVPSVYPVDVQFAPDAQALLNLDLSIGFEGLPSGEVSIWIFSDSEDIESEICEGNQADMKATLSELLSSGRWRERLPSVAAMAEANRKIFEEASGLAIEVAAACEVCRGFVLIARVNEIGFERTFKIEVPFSFSCEWVTMGKVIEAATVAAECFVSDLKALKKSAAERN